jgi:hypothetical protein
LEALEEGKDIQTIIKERIIFKPFSFEVGKNFDEWVEKEFENIMAE